MIKWWGIWTQFLPSRGVGADIWANQSTKIQMQGGGGVARKGDVEAFNWSKHYLVQVSELFGKRYTKEIIT